MTAKSIARYALLRAVAATTRRHPVLLPQQAADDAIILDAVAPYRIDGHNLVVTIREPSHGTLTANLLIPQHPNSWRCHWRSLALRYDGPAELCFNVGTGNVSIGDRTIGKVTVPLPSRRFCWSLEWRSPDDRVRRSRVTGHYLPGAGVVDHTYFSGGNYVDYEAESVTPAAAVVELIRRFPFQGAALEIGCATGALLERLTREGIDAIGVDFSAWAVEQARQRIGTDRVCKLDVEGEMTDFVLHPRAPFGALIMLAVFEHFVDPFTVLARLSESVAPAGRLFLTTTNADGIGRQTFGRDWEGYFDWTHHGVDRVSVRSLREGLPRSGWRVDLLETTLVWDCSADPTHATLREWWASDARFRQLLLEREIGDLITCVATKQ